MPFCPSSADTSIFDLIYNYNSLILLSVVIIVATLLITGLLAYRSTYSNQKIKILYKRLFVVSVILISFALTMAALSQKYGHSDYYPCVYFGCPNC